MVPLTSIQYYSLAYGRLRFKKKNYGSSSKAVAAQLWPVIRVCVHVPNIDLSCGDIELGVVVFRVL